MLKATDGQPTEVTVWDIATRIFHWSLVLLVSLNLFVISPRGGLLTIVHFVSGYAVLGLVLFRLAWGFVGSPHSRFADFVRGWPTVRAYADRLRFLAPPRSVGHNPLGGWMIVGLLAVVAAMVGTGLLAASRRAAGPLAHLLSPALAATIGSVHVLLSDLLVAMIVVHVLGVAVDRVLTGEKLVRAMITGRKTLDPVEAVRERPLAPAWRAILFAILALIAAVFLAVETDYSQTRDSLGILIPDSPWAAASSARARGHLVRMVDAGQGAGHSPRYPWPRGLCDRRRGVVVVDLCKSGERRDHIEKQLSHFASNARGNDIMHENSKGLTPGETREVAAHLSSL